MISQIMANKNTQLQLNGVLKKIEIFITNLNILNYHYEIK